MTEERAQGRNEDWLGNLEDILTESNDEGGDEKVTVPKKFKADGKIVELPDGEKALEYIRKGLNYEKKMEAIRPMRQIVELVQTDPVAKNWLQRRVEELVSGESLEEGTEIAEATETAEAPQDRGIDPEIYHESLRLSLKLSRPAYNEVKAKLIEMIADEPKGIKAAVNYDPDTYIQYFEKAYQAWLKEKGLEKGKGKPSKAAEAEEGTQTSEKPPFILGGGERESQEEVGSDVESRAKAIWEMPRDKFLEKINKLKGLNL